LAYGLFILVYILSRSFIKGLVAMVMLLIDPIIAWQFKQTMLDMTQVCFLVWHVVLIVGMIKQKHNLTRLLLSILAGITLGLFGGVKIGLFLPVIFVIDATILAFMIRIDKKFIFHSFLICLTIFVGIIVGYIASHVPFFLQGGSIVQFFKNEKWVFSFWSQNNTSPIFGIPILALVFGVYKHFSQNSEWKIIEEWSLLWPLYVFGFVSLMYTFWKKIRRLSPELLYVILIVIGIFVTQLLIPFYARYFLMLVPFLLTLFVVCPSKVPINKSLIVVAIIVSVCFKLYLTVYESPSVLASDIQRHFEHSTFQDLYPSLYGVSESRDNFWRRLYMYQYESYANKISLKIDPPFTLFNINSVDVPYELSYFTEAGKYKVNGKMTFIRANHTWKLLWKDTYLNPLYETGDKLQLIVDSNVVYGKLFSKDGKIIIERNPAPYIRWYPDRINDEDNDMIQLNLLTLKSKFDLQNLYKSNHVIQLPIELGRCLDDCKKALQGMIIPDSIEIYSKLEYPVVAKKYSAIVPGEGRVLYLLKANGNKVELISTPSVNGVDLYVN